MPINRCIVCHGENLIFPVERDFLPSMQNYVYKDLNSAKNASKGKFNLALCKDCGFGFNIEFDESLLTYDTGYDNSVPSKIMNDYYRQIAKYLCDKYSFENKLVIDIGCGKGIFLKILCEMFPSVRGLGIDPSYEGEKSFYDSRLKFIPDFFSEKYIKEKPQIVVCRHVLEHIQNPVNFLKSLNDCFNKFENVNFFFETPDNDWIIENNAFWDFCYEHCNYFNKYSLAKALNMSGFGSSLITKSYGNQYLWIEVVNKVTGFESNTLEVSQYVEEFIKYSQIEAQILTKMISILQEKNVFSVWGMATKGVIFSILTDFNKSLIDYCFDINPNKQDCFVPITGHKISSPDILSDIKDNLTIIVMNPNYIDEIKNFCKSKKSNISFLDASGNLL